ncbi:MAG: SRPBCC family protein [Pseudomonadota bacterium]
MPRIFVSSVVDGTCDQVWKRIRDFNAMPAWHPRIRDSRIEDGLPSDKVGCIRSFHLQNGDAIREVLLGMSDYDCFYTYSIIESPMPVTDYVATLRVTPVTDGERSFLEWSAEFECPPSDEDGLVNTIANDVFQGGFDALKRHFGG